MKKSGWAVVGRTDLLVLSAAALALALRLYRLTFQSLWWDEGISLYLAGLDLNGLVLQKEYALDLHPPLYHALLAVWTWFAGPSVFSARAFSALVGVLNVPLLYVLTRRLAGPVAAIVAACLLAVSPVHVFYSQELRMYALMPLLAIGSLWAFVGFWQAESTAQRRRATIWYVLFTAAGLWTYYYVALLVVAQDLFFLAGWFVRRRGFRPWAAGQVVTFLLFAPWLAATALALGRADYLSVAGPTYGLAEVPHFLRVFALAFATGFTEIAPWTYLGAAVLYLFGLIGLLAGRWRSPGAPWLVILWLLVPPVLAYAIATQRAFLFPRFVLYSAMALYGLAGVGVALPWRRSRPLAGVCVVLLLSSGAFGLYYHYVTPRTAYASSDYLPLLGRVAGMQQPGDALLSNQAWGAGYARAYLPAPQPGFGWLAPEWSRDAPAARSAAARVLNEHRRVWLLDWCETGACPPSLFEQQLGAVTSTLYVEQLGEFRLSLLATAGQPAVQPPLSGRGDKFGDAIGLSGWRAPLGLPTVPGQQVALEVAWQAVGEVPTDYTVFTQLIGPDGKVHGQKDGQPIAGSCPTSGWSRGEIVLDRYSLALDAQAPPGTYRLIVGWYDLASGKRLPVDGGDYVELASFDLKRN